MGVVWNGRTVYLQHNIAVACQDIVMYVFDQFSRSVVKFKQIELDNIALDLCSIDSGMSCSPCKQDPDKEQRDDKLDAASCFLRRSMMLYHHQGAFRGNVCT
jgi:hypothetical protein